MKKLMLILAVAALPMVAFADTPAKKTTKKHAHKAHTIAASPAPAASPSPAAGATTSTTAKKAAPATKASPAAKASPSPAAK